MADALDGIRAEIAQLGNEAERVDYLLDVLRFYLDPLPAFVHGVACLGLALSQADVRVLHALDRRRGQFVSIEALHGAVTVDRPECDWAWLDAIPARVSHIRRRLAKMRVPVAIEFCPGVGFRLVAPDGFCFEREAAIAPVRQ